MNVFLENKLKKAFIKNNPFADYGINASVQHNKLYAQATTKAQKARIREYWRQQLDDIGAKYVHEQTRDCFLQDVCELNRRMNNTYGHLFCATGFKVSHAQKSLAIYLKFKWCRGIFPAPPLCPIDRNVLKALGEPWKLHPWTTMTWEDYLADLDEIARRSERDGLSVAQWELLLFSGNESE